MQICRLNVCMIFKTVIISYRLGTRAMHFIIIVIIFLFVNNYFHNDARQLCVVGDSVKSFLHRLLHGQRQWFRKIKNCHLILDVIEKKNNK